jgi:hypothetical protein
MRLCGDSMQISWASFRLPHPPESLLSLCYVTRKRHMPTLAELIAERQTALQA